MKNCPCCGQAVDDFLKCEFRDCENEAEFEGWYRVLDFANQPTGVIQKMKVCKNCVQFLIGYKGEKSNVLLEPS